MQKQLQLQIVQNNVHGNSATATKIITARKITLSGAVNGNVEFDGTEDVTIKTEQSNIVILTGNITLTNGNGSVNINYPSRI